MRQRSTCTIMMGREEYGEGKELLMIQNIPPHQWSMVVIVSWRGHVWLPMELVPLYLLMMWLLIKAAGWIIKCFRQYCLLVFSQMLQNCIGRRFTVQMDNDPKHTAKATKQFFKAKKWNVMQWPSQSPDLNPIELAFHLLKTKLKGKCPKNKQELKTVCSGGLAEHHQGWNSVSGDVYAFQTSGCNWLQRISNQVLKSENLIYIFIVSLSHYFWSLKKWEAHIETVVIPTPFIWFVCKYPQIKAESLQLKHILFVSFQIHYGGV